MTDHDVPTPKQRIKMILRAATAQRQITTDLDEALIGEWDEDESIRVFQRAGAPEKIAVLLAQRMAIGSLVVAHVGLKENGR